METRDFYEYFYHEQDKADKIKAFKELDDIIRVIQQDVDTWQKNRKIDPIKA